MKTCCKWRAIRRPQLSDLVPGSGVLARDHPSLAQRGAQERQHAAALIEEIRAAKPQLLKRTAEWKVPRRWSEREYEYVAREPLGVGDQLLTIPLSGEQGVGRRALIERLIGLSRHVD